MLFRSSAPTPAPPPPPAAPPPPAIAVSSPATSVSPLPALPPPTAPPAPPPAAPTPAPPPPVITVSSPATSASPASAPPPPVPPPLFFPLLLLSSPFYNCCFPSFTRNALTVHTSIKAQPVNLTPPSKQTQIIVCVCCPCISEPGLRCTTTVFSLCYPQEARFGPSPGSLTYVEVMSPSACLQGHLSLLQLFGGSQDSLGQPEHWARKAACPPRATWGFICFLHLGLVGALSHLIAEKLRHRAAFPRKLSKENQKWDSARSLRLLAVSQVRL